MVTIIRRKGFGICLKERFKTVVYGTKRFIKTSITNGPVLPWGLTIKTGINNVINTSVAISLLSDKPRFRKLLEPSEVRVPKTFYNMLDACNYIQDNFGKTRLIGRQRYHFAARNFWVCETMADISASDRAGCVYWQELLPKDREFRIFVAFGGVWVFMEKIVQDKAQPAWNHSKGAHFVTLKRTEWLSKACWYALKAQEISGIDIAAFDIILSGGKLYLLEGNTAPAITGPYKQNLLEEIFMWVDDTYTQTGALPKHHPLPDKSSVGWKNFILPEIM